jgi:hypothetical protein
MLTISKIIYWEVKYVRKIKMFLEAAVIIVVVLALVLPSSTAVTNDVTPSEIIQNKVASYRKAIPDDRGGARGDDVMIPTFSEGFDRLPSITMDNSGHTVVTFTHEEDVLSWPLTIAYSADPTDPMSWTTWEIALEGVEMIWYSDTAYIDGPEPDDFHGLFGASFYYDLDLISGYTILDITQDPGDTTYWEYFSWSYDVPDQVCRSIEDGGYYLSDTPYGTHYGPINMFIYHWVYQNPPFDIPGCPGYVNHYLEEDSATFCWDAQTVFTSAPASDCDYAALPDRFHCTWEYHNESTDTDKIVWKKVDPAIEGDLEYTPFYGYVGDGTNPSVEAYEDSRGIHVAIVYVDDGVVKCVYSNDDGENWESPVTIATGSYPALRAISTKLFCTYIDDGNLYLVESADGGMTWGSAEQINDEPGSVVEEENAVDIHTGGIVWVDNRGDDYDIYYDKFDVGSPPGPPTITGPTSGKVGEEIEFTFNAVDPDGDNVKYYIDWGDDNSEETGFNPSGTDVKVKHTWQSKGTYTIRAYAEDTNGLAGPEGPSLTITITKGKNRAITSPFQWFLQQYPNLFPILRLLFQR